ncbi:hypothetical protein BaRGS_00023191 [Batillaria attramentaria]|uniref:Uncharacterized protein n=1 Tax=Batillaria attramentaria TaxID=370345 RepID=A0ABD0KF09_9CAEN
MYGSTARAQSSNCGGLLQNDESIGREITGVERRRWSPERGKKLMRCEAWVFNQSPIAWHDVPAMVCPTGQWRVANILVRSGTHFDTRLVLFSLPCVP